MSAATVLWASDAIRLVEVDYQYDEGDHEQDRNPFDLSKDRKNPRAVFIEIASGKDLLGQTKWKELRTRFSDQGPSANEFRVFAAEMIMALNVAGVLT